MTLPEAGAVHTPSTALSFFDNANDGSPLVSFAETSSGMLGFIRAVVVSRRNAKRAVTSQRRGSVGFVVRHSQGGGGGGG